MGPISMPGPNETFRRSSAWSPSWAVLAHVLERDQTMWTMDDLDGAVDHLLGHASLGAGALAVELVGAVGSRYAWPEKWRGRLEALRAHPNGDIAALARTVRTATE